MRLTPKARRPRTQVPHDAASGRLAATVSLKNGDAFRSGQSRRVLNLNPSGKTGLPCFELGATFSTVSESPGAPWRKRLAENRQGPRTPLVVGFCRDETGTIRPFYGERLFRSRRQISAEENRQVNLLVPRPMAVDAPELLKGRGWNSLPEDLRSMLERGEILVTTAEDLYAPKDNGPSEHAERAVGNERSAILFYSEDRGNTFRPGAGSVPMGRMGVLCRVSGQTITPVIAQVGEHQYVIELKGCGTVRGGFAEAHFRSGHEVITGGVKRSGALVEHAALERVTEDGGPLIAGTMLFDFEGTKAGYTVRLAPSTIRASFADGGFYPDMATEEHLPKVLHLFAEGLTREMFHDTPRIISRSSHAENLLVWGNDRFAWTDYSDQPGLADERYPADGGEHGYLTHRRLLELCLESAPEVPGYA